MIYLMLEVFVFLVLAAALGAAAGWLWRHRDATAEIDALERRVVTGGDRGPALEAALKERDDKLAELERTLAGRERVLERALVERDEVLERAIAERDAATAELAAVHEQALVREQAERNDDRLERAEAEQAALRDRLAEAVTALATAERRVEELSRERALQTRALKAMEQQLEMARERIPKSASV